MHRETHVQQQRITGVQHLEQIQPAPDQRIILDQRQSGLHQLHASQAAHSGHRGQYRRAHIRPDPQRDHQRRQPAC